MGLQGPASLFAALKQTGNEAGSTVLCIIGEQKAQRTASQIQNGGPEILTNSMPQVECD